MAFTADTEVSFPSSIWKPTMNNDPKYNLVYKTYKHGREKTTTILKDADITEIGERLQLELLAHGQKERPVPTGERAYVWDYSKDGWYVEEVK